MFLSKYIISPPAFCKVGLASVVGVILNLILPGESKEVYAEKSELIEE